MGVNTDMLMMNHHAYAAGETYLPDGIEEPGWYQPVPRGLEIKIGE